jgi:hypothetical protein
MTFDTLYQFTPVGMARFEAFFRGAISADQIDPTDASVAVPVQGSSEFEPKAFGTTKEMAKSILEAMNGLKVDEYVSNTGFWAWLTFVLRDTLFKVGSDGAIKPGAYEVWMPSDPNDYQKAQRHKVRMPVQLFAQFGDDADHALCGRPDTPGEVREQCTSQQGMFTQEFQKLCKRLYFDTSKETNKIGAAGKGGGSARRLPQIVNQFQVTWEVHSFKVDDWVQLLPAEFDKFTGSKNSN